MTDASTVTQPVLYNAGTQEQWESEYEKQFNGIMAEWKSGDVMGAYAQLSVLFDTASEYNTDYKNTQAANSEEIGMYEGSLSNDMNTQLQNANAYASTFDGTEEELESDPTYLGYCQTATCDAQLLNALNTGDTSQITQLVNDGFIDSSSIFNNSTWQDQIFAITESNSGFSSISDSGNSVVGSNGQDYSNTQCANYWAPMMYTSTDDDTAPSTQSVGTLFNQTSTMMTTAQSTSAVFQSEMEQIQADAGQEQSALGNVYEQQIDIQQQVVANQKTA